MTKDDWGQLEPHLAAAEGAAHDHFMADPQYSELLGDSGYTPGYLLLQRLRAVDDQEAVQLFHAMEMYHHELTRADITAAFLCGRTVGGEGRGTEGS